MKINNLKTKSKHLLKFNKIIKAENVKKNELKIYKKTLKIIKTI